MTTTATIRAIVLFASMALAAKVATAVESESGFFVPLGHSDAGLSLEVVTASETGQDVNKHATSSSSSSSSLRGGSTGLNPNDVDEKGLKLPPIPPFHPVHTGQVHYSSVMDVDGRVTYRRDIQAPCDYGMLIFNIGPSKDDLPYHYDVYGDAYLWSDNGGLCILYPTYFGYQVSNYGPFWRPGYDPTTVRFGDLVAGPGHMHRISSRIMRPSTGADEHSAKINRSKAGDFIIMGHHSFYGINFYKQLKDYVNGWGPNGPSESDSNNNEFGWMLLDATVSGSTESTTATAPKIDSVIVES